MEALTISRREAAEDTYHDVKKLIMFTVWRFFRRYGGDVEELMSAANAAYITAYGQAESSHSFTGLLQTIVWRAMINLYRKNREARLKIPLKRVSPKSMDAVAAPRQSNWSAALFLSDLSEDAKTVVGLTLDTPAALARLAEMKGGRPECLRSTIREYLIDSGWAKKRFISAINEIREAL